MAKFNGTRCNALEPTAPIIKRDAYSMLAAAICQQACMDLYECLQSYYALALPVRGLSELAQKRRKKLLREGMRCKKKVLASELTRRKREANELAMWFTDGDWTLYTELSPMPIVEHYKKRAREWATNGGNRKAVVTFFTCGGELHK